MAKWEPQAGQPGAVGGSVDQACELRELGAMPS